MNVVGAVGELDRQVLERMLPPFEHMLRNSIVHGIETPDERVKRNKAAGGTITVKLHREGSEMVIILQDDGRGIDVNAVREKAKAKLGPKFDIKAFHDAVLGTGRVPLDILQQVGDRWLASQA